MKNLPFCFTLFLLICLMIPVMVTAQPVDIPDPNLRAAIEGIFGKASGDPISTAEMATLIYFDTKEANISDLTGLESAVNLTFLFLWDNAISDLRPSVGLDEFAISGSSGQLGLGSFAGDGLNQPEFSGDSEQLGIGTITPCGKHGVGGEGRGECEGKPAELSIYLYTHSSPTA